MQTITEMALERAERGVFTREQAALWVQNRGARLNAIRGVERTQSGLAAGPKGWNNTNIMNPAQTNQFGPLAFHGDVDFARPNEAYHDEGPGIIDNDMGTPQMVRRQAYWTMLCGGAGHAIWG